ncbi:hypothetical protein K490DRAFT_60469 [Saccharata proteae CBS 121410]|uniref:Uncharacterized protein n=1 Tax=Saccharata proteae CBS 121410 TaxID=1314787 RepID=A0A9P4LT78_9PEZI|nr:hypothetical protein K490DRAFT_60469 [Saccharata proteae CBS 121410]
MRAVVTVPLAHALRVSVLQLKRHRSAISKRSGSRARVRNGQQISEKKRFGYDVKRKGDDGSPDVRFDHHQSGVDGSGRLNDQVYQWDEWEMATKYTYMYRERGKGCVCGCEKGERIHACLVPAGAVSSFMMSIVNVLSRGFKPGFVAQGVCHRRLDGQTRHSGAGVRGSRRKAVEGGDPMRRTLKRSLEKGSAGRRVMGLSAAQFGDQIPRRARRRRKDVKGVSSIVEGSGVALEKEHESCLAFREPYVEFAAVVPSSDGFQRKCILIGRRYQACCSFNILASIKFPRIWGQRFRGVQIH